MKAIALLLLSTAPLLAANSKPKSGLPKTAKSGPKVGVKLPIFQSQRVTKSTCVHCAMT